MKLNCKERKINFERVSEGHLIVKSGPYEIGEIKWCNWIRVGFVDNVPLYGVGWLIYLDNRNFFVESENYLDTLKIIKEFIFIKIYQFIESV